ncbi:cyclic nucleotide-gated olfactory channel-like [Falco peregrinus]|uniref:cyclic nucleotide-gated olfactory channel-like n=1 Tax=Falco peregrinus TaxID=8954 RepID=UPI002479364E|nr:cyclic nucleotide-gated olfactory channel-like [Falco peregrinus]
MHSLGSLLSRRWVWPRRRSSTELAATTDPGTDTGRASGATRSRTWILDPSGDWYYWWISIMALPVLYNWIFLICRSCFPDLQEQHAVLWLSLDYLCDALYLLDIAVHFHTGWCLCPSMPLPCPGPTPVPCLPQLHTQMHAHLCAQTC